MTDSQPPVPPVPPAPEPGAATPPPPAAPTAPAAEPAYPAYGQTPAPGYYAPPTNTLAIVAMVLSLAGIITGITAIVGAILGHVALGQIKRTGEGGRPLALTAIIAGWIITGLGLLIVIGLIIFYVVLFATVGAAGGFSDYPY
jgi:hypothetical protein